MVDSAGNIFIADTGNNVIRKIGTDGKISTIAGDIHGIGGTGGDGGPATSAKLNNPEGLALDKAGNLYIGDVLNHKIRKVSTNGIITTVAGTGIAGYAGDGGLATNGGLNDPKGIAVDSAGNIFIADTFSSRIRRVTPDGGITTVAGNGIHSDGGDSGPADLASLHFPTDVRVDASGNVYIADNQNNRIRRLTPVQQLPAIGTGGLATAAAFGGSPLVGLGSWVEIFGANLATTTRTWSGGDFNGIKAPTSLGGVSVSVGGRDAFVDYVSPSQVNVQVPSNIATGQQQVLITTSLGVSAPYTITVKSKQPGLFAPPSLKVGGNQYAGAVFPDGVTYVLPAGALSGITSKPAHPGDTIILYGVGFGDVSPFIPAGQVAQQANTLVSPVKVFFGSTQAAVVYQGLTPNSVGLYQFNVVVPNVGTNDALPLSFTQDGVNGTQTLYIAVQN